jgi:rubrerythrin
VERGAGQYQIEMFGRWVTVQRAWVCEACDVSWYDGGRECPRCKQQTGKPEKLRDNAKLLGPEPK